VRQWHHQSVHVRQWRHLSGPVPGRQLGRQSIPSHLSQIPHQSVPVHVPAIFHVCRWRHSRESVTSSSSYAPRASVTPSIRYLPLVKSTTLSHGNVLCGLLKRQSTAAAFDQRIGWKYKTIHSCLEMVCIEQNTGSLPMSFILHQTNSYIDACFTVDPWLILGKYFFWKHTTTIYGGWVLLLFKFVILWDVCPKIRPQLSHARSTSILEDL
jgi:hypothetical protein